ncbi:MAG: hypothetical protein M9899_03845 [Bdellovibrionaceae bacterium]|nr:hypothetical protein [Pseudobdellovibrionaceae bacterium]
MKKILQKSFVKKVVLVASSANLILAPAMSSAMEIVFDKTYNISRKANMTTLNWKTVSFEKLSGNRVKYKLVAEHPNAKSLEYLQNVDAVVSEDIKSRLVRKFDIVTSNIEFKNGEAHFELELPYDFETRYLPVKLVKDNGYEDYVVRFRFGDYRFLVANKLINNAVKKDISNIASKDPNDLYQVRRQAKRRVIIRKQESTVPVISVDEIYAASKSATSGSVASETAGQRTQASETPAVKEEQSLFSQFENLANQYGTDTVDVKKAIAREEAAEANSIDHESSSLAEVLPEKTVSASEVDRLIGIESMTFEDHAANNEEDEVLEFNADAMDATETVTEVTSAQPEATEQTPEWITPAEKPQLVEQKIDEIQEEEPSYEDYEGSLFSKFESAANKYNERLDQIQKTNEEEIKMSQEAAERKEREEEMVSAPADLADQLQEKLAEQNAEVVEEKPSQNEFLVYEEAEALDEEDFITHTPTTSTEVASISPTVIEDEYTKVPDDGSIPWLETGTTTDAVLNKNTDSQRDLSSTTPSVYDVAPQEWVFKFSKGFVFKSTLSKNSEDESREPSSKKDEGSFEDYESGVSFEDEELGLDFKKKD